MKPIIAVHTGGKYPENHQVELETLCREACIVGMEALIEAESSLDAVSTAVQFLDRSFLTNSGCGSNLTSNGTVECEASIMSGYNMKYASCGAVLDLSNPISLVRRMQDETNPPISMLVGEDVYRWALIKGLHYPTMAINPAPMTDEMKKALLDQLVYHRGAAFTCETVGAVCINRTGQIAVACSSGGSHWKQPGSLGPAAIIGSGCWANETVGVCSSVAQNNMLMQPLYSHQVANQLRRINEWNPDALSQTLMDAPVLNNPEISSAGVLALYHDKEEEKTALMIGHTTDAYSMAYMTNGVAMNSTTYNVGGTATPFISTTELY